MHHATQRPLTRPGLFAAITLSLISATGARAQDAEQSPPDELAAFEALVYTDGRGGELPYRLLVPEKADEPMPVLLFLHGAGERGEDNRKQLIHGKDLLLKAAREFNCLVVAPQCPAGDKWSVVDWSQDKITFSDEPSEPMRMANALIDDLAGRYNVDRNRLYIMGLSMGGYGSWDAACRWPGRFAAAAPICGGGDTAQAELIRDTPVWVFHGDADPVVNVELSRTMVQAIKDAGGDPKYTEYPGVGHNSWTPAFAEPELLPWMTSQSLNKSGEKKEE